MSRIITKSSIASKIAKEYDLSAAQATRLVESMVGEVSNNLSRGRTVRLAGLGVFKTVKRKARKAHVPTTGLTVVVPPRKRVFFRADQGFTRSVNA